MFYYVQKVLGCGSQNYWGWPKADSLSIAPTAAAAVYREWQSWKKRKNPVVVAAADATDVSPASQNKTLFSLVTLVL